jgi:hypothetical protein
LPEPEPVPPHTKRSRRPDDAEDDEPRTKRSRRSDDEDKPRGRGRRRVLWLAGGGLLLLLVLVGGVLLLMQPSWQTHQTSGFRVDLPASPRPLSEMPGGGAAGLTGVGTVLTLRREEYLVGYVTINRFGPKGDWRSDEAVLNDAINGAVNGVQGGKKVSEKPIEVSGIPGREVVIDAPGKGTAVMRVLVMLDRSYLVLVAGPLVSPESERARRFLDSFAITDETFIANARATRESDQKAAAATAEAQRKTAELFREQERKQQAEGLAFENAAHDGPPVPDPATLRGLTLYLPFEDPDPTVDRVSGKPVLKLNGAAKTGVGVRGRGLLLGQPEGTADGSGALDTFRAIGAGPFTLAGWYKSYYGEFPYLVAYGPNSPRFWPRLAFAGGPSGPAQVARAEVALPTGSRSGNSVEADANDQSIARNDTSASKWHHFAIVREVNPQGQVVTLYLDGKPGSRHRLPKPVDLSPLSKLWVGGMPAGPRPPSIHKPHPYQGALDELCLFNRPLSEAEVRFLAGLEKAPPDPSD